MTDPKRLGGIASIEAAAEPEHGAACAKLLKNISSSEVRRLGQTSGARRVLARVRGNPMMHGRLNDRDELVGARRRVAEMRLIVADYRERIAELQEEGRSTREEDETLDVLLGSLALFEEYEQSLSVPTT